MLLKAQTGTIRGNVADRQTGAPIVYSTVSLEGTPFGAITDQNGFFSISNIPAGNYRLMVSYLGYGNVIENVEVSPGGIAYRRIFLEQEAIDLEAVDISAERERARTEVQISRLNVRAEQIKALPSAGGDADLAQYLSVLPGIVSSGDQGGQLYIRGGAPVQNKILLDGMVIYNPFHSIGLFSVFETETIRDVDVQTAGFNAEHGGRVSAVVDIKTRDGNPNRFGGLVSVSPFQAKGLFEGPIRKLQPEGGGSISFMLTGKTSYIDQTSKWLYNYAVDTTFFAFASRDTNLNAVGNIGLPYRYTDLYGKLSFAGENGSKLDVFGFNFSDAFDFVSLASVNWNATGGGASFTLIPANSSVVMAGSAAYSSYLLELIESDGAPRQSGINSYSAQMHFTTYGRGSQLNYGFEFTGFNTDFRFRNLFGQSFQQEDFTTELAGFLKYRQQLGKLVLEPGFRLHFYASQSKISPEPRLGLKYNLTPRLRLKAAGGQYAQNLLSTVNDLDVVNFFVGFLAGPEETLYSPDGKKTVQNRLQRAWHAVGGLEADITRQLTLNVEGYWKEMVQLIQVNRNKLKGTDPNFSTETGEAYGADLFLKYQMPSAYFWLTYSLAFVNRNDGEQDYPTVFDRRHNVNVLGVYSFGPKRLWELSARWNLGSGFPFTQTQGFFQNNPFSDLILTNVLTGNYPIGVILAEQRNGGRLPYYHRLDASLKRSFPMGQNSEFQATLSVTNAYNRANVFYVDRITNRKVNQLPILPALNLTWKF